MTGGLTAVGFLSWKQWLERDSWQRNVLGKFVAKMKNQRALKMFTLWGRWVAEEKRYRVVVGRFLYRIQNRFVMGVFTTWVGYKNERRWLRGLLNKMVGGREFKMMSGAWRAWGGVVRDMKMLEAIGGSGEEIARLKLALEARGAGADADARNRSRLTHFFSKLFDRDAEFWLNRRTLQYAWGKWTGFGRGGGRGGGGGGEGGPLEIADVERIDNYMVMFAHAFNNVHQISSLFAVAAVSVAHMLRGARGSLFLIDKRNSEVFTVSGAAVRRFGLGQGIVGHCARTGESVFGAMFHDPR
jgi:hypothetical protein